MPPLLATEEDLRQAITNGLLDETHHVELKAQVDHGRSANREFAKDIAAMAIHGGVLYVGIGEGTDGNLKLTPVPLDGLKERLDQVARSIPTPPVSISCRTIPSASGHERGYLIVTVLPSSEAPHMVDGRYPGRSDTTTYALTDAEVLQLHQRRAAVRDVAFAMLDAEIARDPAAAAGLDRQAHLFVVAQPVVDDPELLLRSIPADETLRSWLSRQLASGPMVRGSGTQFSPDLGVAIELSWRANGFGKHTHCISPDRGVRPNGAYPAREDDLLDLEIREDGGIRLFCGRASDDHQADGSVVLFSIVAGLTHRVLMVAREIASQSQYLGGWHVGVALTNMRGRSPYQPARMFSTPAPFSEDRYLHVVACSNQELLEDSKEITKSALGRLQRSLNVPDEDYDKLDSQR